ncbi:MULTISPECIES: hypothetical protein [unclassified Sphingomonas]|jgi:hypothetical protein|uniref:hypothetical protein n=1 Tax=unclassified Sphingomonas TaxID=196159 RepID=UPI000E10CC70|nr:MULTISPECIES: hypothetical protein [unclassified Sphingomonas]AXJ96085.1 hypothetical protein DM480_11775 [Sphingomonas sp. FARSPH]
MYSESDIDGAVAAGAISSDAAAALRRHVAAAQAAPAVDEEHFRLLTGFNDIFVSIAIALLLAALGQIGFSISHGLGGAFVAAAAWMLALYFTARRRMALPSILLLLAFVGGVAAAIAGGIESVWPRIDGTAGALAMAATGLIAAGAAWLHWRRFMVPITVAAGAAALVVVAIGLLTAAIPGIRQGVWPLLLVCGVAVFALAMRWDMSDPQRETRRADVAFWLHLAAAPMIAHPIFKMLGVFDGDIGAGIAVIVIALYLLFAGLALAVDRRALLVSSLVYVLYALYSLFRSAGAVELGAAFTAFVIGSALLTLSAFWQPMRAMVVGWLSQPLRVKLPPVHQPA